MGWQDILKDDWKPPPRKPKVSQHDKIINYLKKNPDVPLMSIFNDLDLHMSMNRMRKFIDRHTNITSRRKPIGATGNSETLYRYVER
jgi:hypothetical protein